MRDILFRGKRVDNGEWVYGYYCPCVFGNFPAEPAIIDADELKKGRWAPVRVIPETVGQYTGLTDKKGKKIFEGDIVKLTDKSFGYKWKAVVEFGNPNGNYTWGWQLKPIGKAKNVNTDILCWVEMEETGAFCEVIGTIYDNPELLEVKNERL